MTPKSRKPEISQNIGAGEGFGHENRPNFFAGANFIVSRRGGSEFKCLVEWLHRREIASAWAIVHTNALVQCMFFRFSDQVFFIEANVFRKFILIMQLQYY